MSLRTLAGPPIRSVQRHRHRHSKDSGDLIDADEPDPDRSVEPAGSDHGVRGALVEEALCHRCGSSEVPPASRVTGPERKMSDESGCCHDLGIHLVRRSDPA